MEPTSGPKLCVRPRAARSMWARARRLVLASTTMLSFMAFVGVVSLWVRSHWRSDYIHEVERTALDRNRSNLNYLAIMSSAGGFAVFKQVESSNTHGIDVMLPWPPHGAARTSGAAEKYPWLPQSPSSLWTRLGFDYRREIDANEFLTRDNWAVVVPYWFPAALAAVLPGWWLLSLGGRRRAAWGRRGLCAACGYDLRGSPERCPECGVVPRPAVRVPVVPSATNQGGNSRLLDCSPAPPLVVEEVGD